MKIGKIPESLIRHYLSDIQFSGLVVDFGVEEGVCFVIQNQSLFITIVLIYSIYANTFSTCFEVKVIGLQGYRLTFFCQEQAGTLKQNDWRPSPKLRGPGFDRKLN